MEHPLAAIDLGTNTARLLIGNISQEGRVTPLVYMRRITRLGGGFTRERGISAEARERTAAALCEFAAEMERRGVARTRAVATSAVRDAANGEEFRARIRRETNIDLEVIDGETEGILTLRGVLAEIDDRDADFLV
ncbi:MAG TPA: exopolyphosphatase, partial [Geobacteraceae bacterium]